jgi:hypothetical protein
VTGRLAQEAGKNLHWLGCSNPTDVPTNGLPPQRTAWATAGNIAPRLPWRHRPTEIYGPIEVAFKDTDLSSARCGTITNITTAMKEGCHPLLTRDVAVPTTTPAPLPPEISSARGTPCVARCRTVLSRKSKLAVDFGRKEASFPLWCRVSSKSPGNSLLRESIISCVEGKLCLKARKDYFQAPSFLCLEQIPNGFNLNNTSRVYTFSLKPFISKAEKTLSVDLTLRFRFFYSLFLIINLVGEKSNSW